jgi:hypothetical protein
MVGAHQALIWLAQDAGGAVSAGDTELFLDDLVANTRSLTAEGGPFDALRQRSLLVGPSSGAPT